MNVVAVLNSYDEVVGWVSSENVSEKQTRVEVAGCFTREKDPVNISVYKLSRSKKNIKKVGMECWNRILTKKHGIYSW